VAIDKGAEQTSKMKIPYVLVTLTIFTVLSAVFFALQMYAPDFRFVPLEMGNAIMAGLSLLSWLLVKKQMNGRPQAFVRGVYSASFMKLMVCMVAMLVFVLLNRTHIHRPTVFVLFGIYIIYTVMETWLLSKIVRD
jgi:hypothetical protein